MKEKQRRIKYYLKTIEEDPEAFDECVELADLYLEVGDIPKARAYYEKALLINPTCSITHNELGLLLERDGNVGEAMRSYKAALLVDPGFAEAHNNIGNLRHEEGDLDGAIKSYKKAIKSDPLLAEAFNNIGNVKVDLGKNKSAIKNFRKALEIDPKMAEPYINLGNLYKDIGQIEDAIANYRVALRLSPKEEATRHNLNAALGKTTKHAPKDFVQEIFDEYAPRFDSHLVDDLGYKIPSILRESIEAVYSDWNMPRGLDLGCGTGICGSVFSDKVVEMVGIDISPKMLEVSKNKKVYSELVLGELNEILSERTDQFDFFVSADVFIYVGDLDSIFSSVKRLSNGKALFVFSTEHVEGDSYVLLPSGRYAHSEKYIKKLSSQYGFSRTSFSFEKVRREGEKWIKGGVYILET